MTVLLGGRDAAMGPLDQRRFQLLFGAGLVVGLVGLARAVFG